MRLTPAFIRGILLLMATVATAQDEGQFYKGMLPYTLAPRFALVIGVSSVSESGVFYSLPNPVHDAEEIAKALRRIGFTVIAPHENYAPGQLTRQIIKRSLYDFALLLKETKGAIGLVYFSGHGIELYGHNYLVAYDGYVRFDRDLHEELIPIAWFYDAFKYAGNKFNLLFIDACRNFPWEGLPPFGSQLKLDTKILQSENVLKAYATYSGNVALDGKWRISPYAAAFLYALEQRDIPLSEFFSAIARHVKKSVLGLQTPTADAVGTYDFVFFPTIKSFNQEFQIFKIAERSNSPQLLEQVVTKYAHGYFGRSAEAILQGISKTGPQPTKYVEMRTRASLYEYPWNSRVVEVVEAGTQLGIYDQLEDPRKQRVPVHRPTGGAAWADTKVTIATKLVSVSRPMQFQPGPTAGTETLTQEARESVKAALKDTARIRGVKVQGWAYYADTSSAPPEVHRLLARQAAVTQALEDAGFKAGKVTFSQEYTTEADKHNLVELIVTFARAEK